MKESISRSLHVFEIFHLSLFYSRLELEDLEMKHNSAVKQMMREFNTQVALKETEIDSAVRETIGKTAKTHFENSAFSNF